jgi:DNA-binding XRE family transcriptional regulator
MANLREGHDRGLLLGDGSRKPFLHLAGTESNGVLTPMRTNLGRPAPNVEKGEFFRIIPVQSRHGCAVRRSPTDPQRDFPAHRAMMPGRSRTARGWLGWSQVELARRASVSERTVQVFEGGHRTHANSIGAMRRAIGAAGIRLIFDQDGTAAGILRQDANPDLSDDAPA